MNPQEKQKVGAALVIGGGIAGIQASLDLANSGIKVYLLEKSPAIGGRMAQLDKTFRTFCRQISFDIQASLVLYSDRQKVMSYQF